MRRVLALVAFCASTVLAQTPTVSAVQDAAAYTADVAPGAMFVVKGSNLSPSGFLQATASEYPGTLNGVQISLTPAGGGTAVTALMMYTFNLSGLNQLAAVLPSTVTAGAYDLRVSNGGTASAPFRMNVVARKPGIVTAGGTGSGDAQATLGGGLVLARRSNEGKIGAFETRPARPGERVDLWGTGLGADAASDTGGSSGDQTAAGAIRVLLNGADVIPLYAGRVQGFPGLDQIGFTMPGDVTPGCAVPIQVRAGGVTGNQVTIPISTTDTCPASGGGGTNPTQAEIDSWIARGYYVAGSIVLSRDTTYEVDLQEISSVKKADYIEAEFARVAGSDLANYLRGVLPAGYPNRIPTSGSCLVYTPSPLTNPYPNLTMTYLDAGPQLTSNGPNGTQAVPRETNPTTGPTYITGPSLPNTYLAAGSYTLSGPGGAAVGPFTGSLTVASEFTVTTNPEDLKTITRGDGATVRWTGGDPNTMVTIVGASMTPAGDGATFVCIQNNSAGQLTVPASILNQLPASVTINTGEFMLVVRGTFSVSTSGVGARFTAPSGVDILTAQNSWTWGYSTRYR